MAAESNYEFRELGAYLGSVGLTTRKQILGQFATGDLGCRSERIMDHSMTKTLRGLAVVFLLLGSPGAAGGVTAGHVAFFFVGVQSGEYFEIHDDFVYFYRGVLPWLDDHGITHSYHSSLPVLIERTQGNTVTFQNESLSGDLGMILLKQDGSYRILHGVYTGVDLILEIKRFFRFEQQAE